MKSFPFDSELTYDSDGNPEYDRGVDSTILSEFLHLMYKDGVFPNPSTGLQVTSSDNEMSVVVNPGNVMIQGRMGIEETYRTIVFEEAGTTYDRIDSVVARLNTNHDYRSIDLYVVKGTEASSPVAPDLARTGGIYELRLANVFIAKNTTKVSSERITDTRLNDEDCGIVTANPDTVDTTKIFNQYQASLDAYMQYVQECIDGTTAGNLQSQIDKLDVRTTDVENGLEELNSNLISEISRSKEADETLKSRVDNIVSLPEGSTIGDAELQDIRVKADGTTATSAGNAVREQVSELKGDLINYNDTNNERFIESVNKLKPKEYRKGGYYNGSGSWKTEPSVDTSNFIPCSKNEKFYMNYNGGSSPSYFNSNKQFISQGSTIRNGQFVIPNDSTIAYFNVTFSSSHANYNKLMMCKDILPDVFISPINNDSSFYSLKDRNVLVLGDSISHIESRWINQFKLRLSPKSMLNLAVSGAHMKDYYNTPFPYNGNPIGTSDQLNNVVGNQVQKLINGVNSGTYEIPDITFIFAGTNDNWNYESGFDIESVFTDGDGNYISLDGVERITFAGSMRWIVENLYNVNSAMHIIFITPIQCAEGVTLYPTQKLKVDRIKEVADRMSLKVIDAFNRSGIYGRYEERDANGKWLEDGLHPNIKGGVKLGNFIADEYSNLHLTPYYSSIASWQ